MRRKGKAGQLPGVFAQQSRIFARRWFGIDLPHDAAGGIGARRWAGRAWITCTLHPKPGRALPGVTPPNGYTRLFFLDEAVACAAGHRPCAECRRAAYQAFRAAWARAFGAQASARDMDAVLHDARIVARSRTQRQHSALAESLPDGAFILWDGLPCRIGAALECAFGTWDA